MAGTQRLLTDLQYDIGPIDGFGGERTREAEAAYKLRYGVKGNPKGRFIARQAYRKRARMKPVSAA